MPQVLLSTTRTVRLRLAILFAAANVAGCDKPTEPTDPANVAAIFPSGVSVVAGSTVPSPPGVKVTTVKGKPVAGVAVAFAVKSGSGTILGATTSTNADGIAYVIFWTLGPIAGLNEMTAEVAGLPAVTFQATGMAGPAAKLGFASAPGATAVNRASLPTQPVVQVQDQHGNLAANSTATVLVTLMSGSGQLSGTTSVSAVNGVATFTNVSIAGPTGVKQLGFSSTSLTALLTSVTTTAGAPTQLLVSAGNNRSAAPGAATPVAPAVLVADADTNPVAGVAVSFAVTAGGGSIIGANPTSNAQGVATLGSWTLGPSAGINTVAATSTAVAGVTATFTATGTSITFSGITPATLTPGASATITGTGFGATIGANAVTVDGVASTVTAASSTSLTITVPSLPCGNAHNADVTVSVSGGPPAVTTHPVAGGTGVALNVGQSVILSTAEAARCAQITGSGGTYYYAVYNSKSTYDTTGARFELRGTAGAAPPPGSARPLLPAQLRSLTPRDPDVEAHAARDRAHIQFLERDLEFLRQNAATMRQSMNRRRASRSAAPGITPVTTVAYAVGDPVTVRLPDLRSNFCSTFITISGRVAYLGAKGMIIEDNANPMAGTIDTTYAQIGSEFDAVMWPILETNYGNALVNDAVLDNNGKFVMVFTNKLNSGQDLGSFGLAGFVTSVDLLPTSTCPTSNFGEYFYATSPTAAGTININGSPPRWRWSMRGTIIHEVKHIVSIAERFSRNAPFEVSWLEETTARMSEELYERALYSFAQKSNIGYGSASNQVGPYCGVRLACNSARGIVRVFEELASAWYSGPHNFSPLGRINSSDFSFYATGWSLVRWMIDASPNSESAILKALTQHASLTSMANLEAGTGLTFATSQPKWILSMVADDYPAFTPADATIKQPSWDFRNVFFGYDLDFNVPWVQWPLSPITTSFGTFTLSARVRPGTAAIIQLTGGQSVPQLLELKADGVNASAPAELRVAIIRVQ